MASNEQSMHYVGFCRLCDTGPLGLRWCGGCRSVLVLCDECDAVWVDAHLDAQPQLSDEPDLPCPHCQGSLVGDTSSWATREQIKATAWLAEAVAAGRFTLQQGKPFAPDGPEPTDLPTDVGG